MTQSDNGRYLKMKYYRALNIPISPSAAVTKVSSPITIRSRSPSQPVEIEFVDIEKLDSQSLPDHEAFLPPHLWAMEEDSFSVYDYNFKKEVCKRAI
eukprot:CAMPEP_0206158634 /NCGR_PEP_ID=MMETSP1474-20131121/5029_1 /ASSEMBLY_ACC=CAM_ASM_001110 /TAXON_ID=97495 /ORGANISM="Imantonia sp., Strain RCC918" /LENGTH=96 /DNA_ID=CAMNT_0053558821 /DNA_START=40 /DNA_END=330 /DNA_ORIENTATION=+